jgi:hypothetical protein
MVTFPADNSAFEPKDGIQIEKQSQGKIDAIHPKERTSKGAHSMGTKVIPIATHKPTTSLLDSKE